MEFINKDIPSQRNTSASVSSSSSSYYGGGSSVMTNLGYLELITSTENINNGIIKKNTEIAGTHGSVTGATATYLLHTTTGNTDEGWIFGLKENVSGTTKNIASLDGDGYLTIKGLNISNGNQSVNLIVDGNGKLFIDKTLYSSGDIIAFNSDGSGGSDGSNGGLIEQVFGYADLLNATDGTFSDSDLTNSFNAYSTYQLKKRIVQLEETNVTQQVNISTIQNQLTNIATDKHFRFIQNMPAATWSVNHNLNKYPSVTISDSAGSVVEGEIKYNDINNLTLSFSSAFSGVANLN